jgi:hypothetical protein
LAGTLAPAPFLCGIVWKKVRVLKAIAFALNVSF